MLRELILLLITSIVVIFVALAVLFAHSVSRLMKFCFVVIVFGLLFWQYLIYLTEHIQTHLVFWNNLVFWGPSVALLGSYYFIGQLSAPQRNIQQKHRIAYQVIFVAAILGALLQLCALFSGDIFTDVTYSTTSKDYMYTRGTPYGIYVVGILLLIVSIIVRLILNYRMSRGDYRAKQAAKTFLTTVIVTTSYAIITNVLIPFLTHGDNYIGLGLLSMDIFAVGLMLCIVRYRFLDIRAYVFRSVVYAITLFVTAVIYVGIVSVLANSILHTSLKSTTLLLLSIVTLAIAGSFQVLKGYFNRATNKLFFRDYYEPQEFFNQIGEIVISTLDVNVLLHEVAEVVRESLKAEFCLIVLRPADSYTSYIAGGTADKHFLKSELERIHRNLTNDSQAIVTNDLNEEDRELKRTLNKYDIAVLARLEGGGSKQLGHIIVGAKRSGNPYNKQDISVINALSNQLVIAVQNALRFKEIEHFNETLQEKIDDATRKLRRTNDKLKLLDETKDDFISMASHQLRTPLTSVKGYVSMVLDGDAGKINGMQRKLLNQSFISAQRMVYLISDLLNVSRLRTGKFLIEPVSTNLADVIKGEVEQLIETAEGRNLTLTYHLPQHFPTLMMDETKTRQVIMNFIDNAIYYTPPGGHITVNLVEKPQTVEFTVEDDGIGVPRHEQHHLFTKFYRAENAKRARPDGTGLGLFMAKKVVVAQGGAIIFKSQEGKGSTFGFSFAKRKLLPEHENVVHTDTTRK